MKMKKSFYLIATVMFLASGCVNNYEKFFQGRSDIPPSVLIAHQGEPEVYRGSNYDADGLALMAQGYLQLGYSSFNATSSSESNLIAQAKKIGAAKVLTYQQYTNTEQGAMPLTLPNNQTTYHSGNVSAYGSGGSAYGSYSGTSTTYGSTTTYIPYSNRRYDFNASYWAKAKPGILGVHLRVLTPEERKAIERNTGVAVITPINGTPAFDADILVGDILLSIDGEKLSDGQRLKSLLGSKRGNEVSILIHRKGREIVKNVKLSP